MKSPASREEGRIGTELTIEGSNQLSDWICFAHGYRPARRQRTHHRSRRSIASSEGPAKNPWYDQKGFFEHKLAEPNIWDKGKDKPETESCECRICNLTKEQVRALTTFLLGSQENPLPASYQYRPLDYRRDVQEGWWNRQEI